MRNNKKVFYIGYYVDQTTESSYFFNVPGKLRMEYIINILSSIGVESKIVSLCPRKKAKIRKTIGAHFFKSIPSNNKYVRFFNTKFIAFQLLCYVIFNIPKGSTIILYHSYRSTHLLSHLLSSKRFNAIIQVEEIYGYSASGHKHFLEKEKKDICRFNKGIFVNYYIPRSLLFSNKPYVVNYGVVNFDISETDKFNDGFIHAVYAGTIEQEKLGAFNAAASAEFLPDNFKIDIFGFGKEESIVKLQEIIESINKKTASEKVRFLGYKTSSELSHELGKYDIGLNTYILEPDFANNTSPSKTITYMSYGLSVVSGFSDAFKENPLTAKWSFFYNQSPKEIARAIKDFKPCTLIENQKKLKAMEDELKAWLKLHL